MARSSCKECNLVTVMMKALLLVSKLSCSGACLLHTHPAIVQMHHCSIAWYVLMRDDAMWWRCLFRVTKWHRIDTSTSPCLAIFLTESCAIWDAQQAEASGCSIRLGNTIHHTFRPASAFRGRQLIGRAHPELLTDVEFVSMARAMSLPLPEF